MMRRSQDNIDSHERRNHSSRYSPVGKARAIASVAIRDNAIAILALVIAVAGFVVAKILPDERARVYQAQLQSVKAEFEAKLDSMDKAHQSELASLAAAQQARYDTVLARTGGAERQFELLKYYVMELDGKLMADGLIAPSRSWSARHQQQPKESKP